MAAKVDPEVCTGCGICADECPEGAITLEDVAVVDPEACTECGTCEQECAVGAIKVE